MNVKDINLWKQTDKSFPYVIGGPQSSPQKKSRVDCIRRFCYWSIVTYAIIVTYLLGLFVLDRQDDVVVLQIYNIKTYLVSKFTIVQDINYNVQEFAEPDSNDISTAICDLIYNRYEGWLYNINEANLRDKPVSINNTALEAYKLMILDMCRDAKDIECVKCFLENKDGQAQYSDQKQFDQLKKCTKAHPIPENYNHFKHYVLDKEDDYSVTFSEIMSACIHTIPEYLRGFSTTGIATMLKNDKLQDPYTLRKWLARALITVGFVSDQIRVSNGGIQTFHAMKQACVKVRESGIMENLFKAVMYKNIDNQAYARAECIKTYQKV